MKIFLSHPMTGMSEEKILQLREEMMEWAYEHIGPNLDLIDSYLDLGDVSPLIYISKSIELLDQADVVLVHPDWIFSRGCKVEVDCALLYGKHNVIFMKE